MSSQNTTTSSAGSTRWQSKRSTSVRRTGDKRARAEAVQPKTKRRGLCTTCERAAACRHKIEPMKPVLQCEEHTGIESRLATATHPKASSASPVSVVGEAASAGRRRPLGLCGNCDLLKTCTFTKPEGGIWHCAEYR